MGNVLHKTMEYLGLRDEDAQEHPYGTSAHGSRPATGSAHDDELYEDGEYEYHEEHDAEVMHLPTRHGAYDVAHEPRLSLMSRIITVHPVSFHECPTLGIPFRQGIPVIMDITKMDKDEARRLVDFAAGLTFGLEGHLERIAPQVFLLSPAHVTVSNSVEENYDASFSPVNQV